MEPTAEPWHARTALRHVRPDGSVLSYEVDDRGRVVVVREAADGAVAERVLAELGTGGGVEVVPVDAAGRPVGRPLPGTVERHLNAYGLELERERFGADFEVERSYDDEGRFRRVALAGPWGRFVSELRADGSRALRWETPLHRGERTWDAGGALLRYESHGVDGPGHVAEGPGAGELRRVGAAPAREAGGR
jgi:hypothetical protein